MPDNLHSLLLLNLAFLSVELAKHAELLDWWLTAAGSGTLLCINVVRLWRLWKYPQGKSEKLKKGKR